MFAPSYHQEAKEEEITQELADMYLSHSHRTGRHVLVPFTATSIL